MPRRKPPVRPETTDDGTSGQAGQGGRQAARDTQPNDVNPNETASDPANSAFDLFVERGLHAIYDEVLAEPIPEELLRLIEDDRRK